MSIYKSFGPAQEPSGQWTIMLFYEPTLRMDHKITIQHKDCFVYLNFNPK